MIYVSELSNDFVNVGPGQIEQLDASGNPTANSPFVTGGEDFFAGVAASSVTHTVYAYQTQLSTPKGIKGISQLTAFSQAGVVGASFSPPKSAAQPAVDSADRIYFPNDAGGTVQVFSPTGTLEETITCAGCAGGAFVKPTIAALDSSANLYVVDLANDGRVIKFKLSAGSYAYDSVLQSGEGAVAVGVDPSSNDVFVGDFAESTYHVVVYDSAGNQFDDFAGGVVGGPPFGIETAGQIAANATTHRVYVSDPAASKLWVFNRIGSIPAPTAATLTPLSLGQLEATLQASVNPKGHGLLDCHFEYTTDSDFQAHGFTNATDVPCGAKPVGETSAQASTAVTGLVPDTAYDYRIAVSSNGGSAEGSAQKFETLPPLPPTATTTSASVITQTTAKIAGAVNPRGGPISDCQLQYTTSASFAEHGFTGAAAAECVPIPEGISSQNVSRSISALLPNTEYRFRVVATNNSGTGTATDKTFTTLADTCATNHALCPPEEEFDEAPQPPVPVPLPAAQAPPIAPIKKPLKCRKGFKKKTIRGKQKCVKVKKHKRGRS